MIQEKEHELWYETDPDLNLTLATLKRPQFTYYKSEDNKTIDLMRLFYGSNEKMCAKGLIHSGM